MKKATLIILSLFIFDCTFGQSLEKNFRQIDLEEKIGNRTLKDYLLDEKIPQFFKDIFQQKQNISDNDETFALLDSLFSTDMERHPFYFVLVTRITWWSDGAVSEVLGGTVKEYVETNTQQFLDYFSTESVLTTFDFERWAGHTLGEIHIDSEDNVEQEIENTKRLMKENCVSCSPKKIKMIDKFIKCMYEQNEDLIKQNEDYLKQKENE